MTSRDQSAAAGSRLKMVRPADSPARSSGVGRLSRRPLRPELALLLAGLLPALIVYGIHWRRGHYLDDPFLDGISVRELADTVAYLRARPLGTVLVGITYLVGEPAGRLLGAIMLAATAALAGLLVRRTTGARWSPVVAGLLVMYPLLDWESALYWYAAIQYPAGAAIGLGGGHLFLSALRATSRRGALTSSAGSVALYAAALACTEVAVNLLLLVPGLTLVELLRRRKVDRRTLTRCGTVVVGAGVAVGGVAAFIYLPENEFTSARGALILNPIEAGSRIVRVWIPALRDVAFGPVRARIHAQALGLGIENLTAPVVLVVFVGAVVAGGLALRSMYRTPPDPRRPDDARAALGLLAAATALFALSLFFPAALLSGQGVVPRLLFIPWVALVLVAGAGVAVVEARGAIRTLRATVLITLVALVPLALTLDGYGELYRLRDARNDQQLAAWLGVIDQARPLPPDLRIATFYGSDRLFPRASPVDDTLAGLTETPWALGRLVSQRTGTRVQAISGHPFAPVCIERTADPTQLRLTSLFNDEIAPVEALLAAELQGPRLVLFDGVVFGTTRVELPLAARVTGSDYEHQWLHVEGEKICRVYGTAVP